MTIEKIIDILSSKGCNGCGCDCKSPVDCESKTCQVKRAMKGALEILEMLVKVSKEDGK